MEIGLFCNNFSERNGPGKVASNLIKGLEIVGAKVFINEIKENTGCLQSVPSDGNFLFGPNLFVLPSDVNQSFWRKKRNLVVPCEWVKSKYETQLSDEHVIDVWAVGIDTDKFKPSSVTKTNDCLIYFKNGSHETKNDLIQI